MMRVWFFDMIFGFIVLFIEFAAEVFGRKTNDVRWVFFDDGFGVMFEDVG